MQNFCILAAISKILVFFNNYRRCIISAFQENLSLRMQYSTGFINYHAFYRVQNFCVLVELVNFRIFKSIEQDAEFLQPNNLCTRALIVSADFQGSHRVLFFYIFWKGQNSY